VLQQERFSLIFSWSVDVLAVRGQLQPGYSCACPLGRVPSGVGNDGHRERGGPWCWQLQPGEASNGRKQESATRCMTFDGTQRMDAIVEELRVTGSDPFSTKRLAGYHCFSCCFRALSHKLGSLGPSDVSEESSSLHFFYIGLAYILRSKQCKL